MSTGWRLCRVPIHGTTGQAVHRTYRVHVGVVGQQHGSQGQVVLPPRGNGGMSGTAPLPCKYGSLVLKAKLRLNLDKEPIGRLGYG